SRRYAATAVRAAVAALLSLYLAWLSAAGYLPVWFSNAPAYVAVAAFSYAFLVGLGLASVVRGVAQASFGRRQVGLAIMAVVTGLGLCGQVFQAAKSSWAVGGPERIPPAYPIAGRADGGPYRVLW